MNHRHITIWSALLGATLLAALCCSLPTRAGEKPLATELEAGLLGPAADDAAKPKNASIFDDDAGEDGFNKDVMLLIKELTNFNRDDGRDKRINVRKEDEARDKLSARERYNVAAQDAARKLVLLGKKSVNPLGLVFRANFEKAQKSEEAYAAVYYATWALARIRSAEAAEKLGPLLANPNAKFDLRMLAVDAAGWEKSPLGAAALSRAAEADPELEIRKHALAQLSMIPEFWRKAEPTFVKALADDNDDIRVLAAKACYFSHFFLSANPKLIELAEKDRSPLVRTYALNTLARLKVRQAQPALIRLLSAPDDDEKFRKHVLSTLGAIADFPFHDAKSALDWWTKTGREAYERTAGAEAKTDSAPSAPGADGFAPVVRLNGSGGGLETPASSVPSAEVLDLNGNTVTATPLKTAGDRPRSTVRKFDTDPDPESVGSRKRREQQEKAQQAK